AWWSRSAQILFSRPTPDRSVPDRRRKETSHKPMDWCADHIRLRLRPERSDRVCTSKPAAPLCKQSRVQQSARTDAPSRLRNGLTSCCKDFPTRPEFRAVENLLSAASKHSRQTRGRRDEC